MRTALFRLLSLSLLGTTATCLGQTLIFKGGDRWEVNDPFKVDTTTLPPKPIVDPKKATMNTLKGTVTKLTTNGGVEMETTKKFTDVERIIWPMPEKLTEAQNSVARGDSSNALTVVEPIIRLFEPVKKVPGSWWLKASMIKLDALDRLENDSALSSFLDNLEKADDGSVPELALKIKLARLMQRARRGEHETVITEATALIGQVDDPDVLARLHLVKGNSLLQTKKYELAMNTYLRVPVFFGSQKEHIPKAMLGAAKAFRGMDTPATREQKLEEISNRYLRELVIFYPVSKEAEEAKKLLSKEDRLLAEAEQKKISDTVLPEETPKTTPAKTDNSQNDEGNK